MDILNFNNVLVICKYFTIFDLGHFRITFANSERPKLCFELCMEYYDKNPRKRFWALCLDHSGATVTNYLVLDKGGV
jgi:hypothetical protein